MCVSEQNGAPAKSSPKQAAGAETSSLTSLGLQSQRELKETLQVEYNSWNQEESEDQQEIDEEITQLQGRKISQVPDMLSPLDDQSQI